MIAQIHNFTSVLWQELEELHTFSAKFFDIFVTWLNLNGLNLCLQFLIVKLRYSTARANIGMLAYPA